MNKCFDMRQTAFIQLLTLRIHYTMRQSMHEFQHRYQASCANILHDYVHIL